MILDNAGDGDDDDQERGVVDELWVFDAALSAGEVVTLMDSNVPPVFATPTGPGLSTVPEPASVGFWTILRAAIAGLKRAPRWRPLK